MGISSDKYKNGKPLYTKFSMLLSAVSHGSNLYELQASRSSVTVCRYYCYFVALSKFFWRLLVCTGTSTSLLVIVLLPPHSLSSPDGLLLHRTLVLVVVRPTAHSISWSPFSGSRKECRRCGNFQDPHFHYSPPSTTTTLAPTKHGVGLESLVTSHEGAVVVVGSKATVGGLGKSLHPGEGEVQFRSHEAALRGRGG